MYEIETGNEVWTVDTGSINSVIASYNGSIYASGSERKQFLKLNTETGDGEYLFPIVGLQSCIVQYRL